MVPEYKNAKAYQIKVQELKQRLKEFNLEDTLVLEVGSGGSKLTREILERKARVINSDTQDFYQLGKGYLDVICDALKLPFSDDVFEAVTLFDVIEHIKDDKALAHEIKRVLKPRGYLFILTPSNPWIYPSFKASSFLFEKRDDLIQRWGHVREGYNLDELLELFDGLNPVDHATIFNGTNALLYDLAYLKSHPFVKRILESITCRLPNFLFKNLPGKEIFVAFQK